MENQISLFPDSEDSEKFSLIKKIIKLKGGVTSDYLQSTFKELEKIFEDEKQLQSSISKLKKDMKTLELTYSDEKSFEENKIIYENELDLKKNPSYEYPFKIYFKGHDIQQPDHIFEAGVKYTEKQIATDMFKHGYKEFSGSVKFEFDKDDNLLIPNFTSQKHG